MHGIVRDEIGRGMEVGESDLKGLGMEGEEKG